MRFATGARGNASSVGSGSSASARPHGLMESPTIASYRACGAPASSWTARFWPIWRSATPRRFPSLCSRPGRRCRPEHSTPERTAARAVACPPARKPSCSRSLRHSATSHPSGWRNFLPPSRSPFALKCLLEGGKKLLQPLGCDVAEWRSDLLQDGFLAGGHATARAAVLSGVLCSGRQRLPGLLHKLGKRRGVADRQIGQNLAVQLDAGAPQALYEAIVGDSIKPCGRADALDPEPTELAFPRAPVAKRIPQRALAGFLGGAVELALGQKEAFGVLEVFLAPRATLGSSFDSRHRFDSSRLFRGRASSCKAACGVPPPCPPG